MSSTAAVVSHSWCVRRLARFVIEFTTAFHVGTGRGGKGIDALVVTDANGLPTIPGSSLAGALRDALHREDDALAAEIMGFQNGKDGRGSRLSVSWGCLHASDNQPVEGIAAPELLDRDEILLQARTPTPRDHVRLHHQGAQAHGLKFDEWPVCAGHRFTFEIELVSEKTSRDEYAWRLIKEKLCGGGLRLGAKSRRGFGAFRVVAWREDHCDLSTAGGFADYLSRSPRLADRHLQPQSPPAACDAHTLTATVELAPIGYWMFGGGDDVSTTGNQSSKIKTPKTESRIVWENDRARIEQNALLIAGSSIKGALAHRVVWHAHCVDRKDWVDAATATPATNETPWRDTRKRLADACESHPVALALFGSASNERSGVQTGRRGRVQIDDVLLPAGKIHSTCATHVAIDRVTGGSVNGTLFTQRLNWQTKPGARIVIALTIEDHASIPLAARRALAAALADLCEGRLAIGAGGGRGMGYCQGTLHWSDGGAWTAVPVPTAPVQVHP